jgi:large subunit ribosomal protein L17
MKHAVKSAKLNRDSGHRRALYKNLISAVITHGTIKTTPAKAKAITGQLDRLITQAKQNTVASRRQIDRVLNNRKLVNRLTDVIGKAVGDRTSGFTRMIKLGPRRGDAAPMVRLELVDKLPVPTLETKKAAKKAKKTAKKTTAKVTQSVPQDMATPQVKPQAAIKAGMLRRKSGER